MQVDSTDKGGHRIKRGGLWRSWGADKAAGNMLWNQNALDTHVDPGERLIGKVNTSIIFVLVLV
jgi:hypothetical protein